MSEKTHLERLQEELASYRAEFDREEERLCHENSIIEEAQHEAYKIKERMKELKASMKETLKEIEEEEQKVRCPKCQREFPLDEVKNLLQEDEWGQYWKCPNKFCDFKGYHEKGNFFFEFKELMKRKKEQEQEFYEKNFQKITKFTKTTNVI